MSMLRGSNAVESVRTRIIMISFLLISHFLLFIITDSSRKNRRLRIFDFRLVYTTMYMLF